MSKTERDSLVKFLDSKLCEIGEHFEHVQILASSHEESGTWLINRGTGNWYARQGMAQRFIKDDEAQEAARFVAGELNKD